jgi:hypothetical protein
MSETKNEKPKLAKMVKLRRRDDGVVVFYMASGEPRMGVRESDRTRAMFEAIEAAYADAIALEVSI